MSISTAKALVLLSGGVDSTALIVFLREHGFLVKALFVEYGQAALKQERRAVKQLAHCLGCDVHFLCVDGLGEQGTGELLGRNAFLISMALFASRGEQQVVAIGVHAGTMYFDCSSTFIKQMNRIASECSDGRVAVVAPFLEWSKKDIHNYLERSGVPVDMTYSCEAGVDLGCGDCLSCRDRSVLIAS